MRKSKYIAFEGLDGSGKTTQINKLKSYYEKLGHKVIIARQPGYTKLGEKIREIVLNNEEIFNETDLTLFLASHVHGILKLGQKEEEGTIFILDRTIASTICYQGFSLSLVESLISFYMKLVRHWEIDHLIYLDLDPNIAKDRVSETDRFETRGLDFMVQLRDNYKKLLMSESYPLGIFKTHSVIEIDNDTTPDRIHNCIVEILKEEGLA